MAGIVRTVVRIGVIGTLAGGAVVLIAGPDRCLALMHQARGCVNSAIDRNIEDPVALRSQLRSLEGQYPERIAAVRGDLAQLTEQVAQLERELAVSKRVVALADGDLGTMKSVLARAEEARTAGAFQVVKVKFDNASLSIDEAYAKANRVSQLRSAYATRSADIERDLGYLGQQKQRLSTLLDKLETERAEFQTQLWNMDRQVDAIARNDRMIDLLQKRQRTIEELDNPYAANSLAQLNSRFADIRAKQEAKLQMFSQTSDGENYEDAAKYQLDTEQSKHGLGDPEKKQIELTPSVIEIGPGSEQHDKGQVASRGG